MTKLAMHRPFDECDLDNDLGTYPVRPDAWQPDGFSERGFRNLERIEPRAEFHEQLGIEARTDFPGEDEILILVIADKQCAQADPSSLRIGEPAHHELLRRFALHLQPVRGSAMFVKGTAALRNDAVPTLGARPLPGSWICKRPHALQWGSQSQSV